MAKHLPLKICWQHLSLINLEKWTIARRKSIQKLNNTEISNKCSKIQDEIKKNKGKFMNAPSQAGILKQTKLYLLICFHETCWAKKYI
jgi:hypothetical protein